MNLPLDHLHGLLEANRQLLLEFLFRPEREGSLDAPLVDVLGDEPADRLDEPVAGRAAWRRVVVLLDEHRCEAARAAEILDDPFDDFGAVGDVGSPAFDLRKPEIDARRFNLRQSGPAAGFGPTSLFPFGGVAAGAARGEKSPVTNPEILLSKRVGNATTLAYAALIHDQIAAACRSDRQAAMKFRRGRGICIKCGWSRAGVGPFGRRSRLTECR